MAKKKKENETSMCPVGRIFSDLEKALEKDSDFFKHLKNSRVEFLKAIRVLVDVGLDEIEKKDSTRSKKKMTKVKVE